MKTFKERLERIHVEEPVHIPTLDGKGIAETVTVKVPAWRDPNDGEIYLDTEATAILDKVKARHMGLLTPEQIKRLRERLGLTQKQISELLQIGEKTWTRWETGRERPSRSINVLLSALNDGRIDACYLRSLSLRRNDWQSQLIQGMQFNPNPWILMVEDIWKTWMTSQKSFSEGSYPTAVTLASERFQPDLAMDVDFKLAEPSFCLADIKNMQPVKLPESRYNFAKPTDHSCKRFQPCKEIIAA